MGKYYNPSSFFSLYLPWGGFCRFPVLNLIEPVGQTPIQVAQLKQSGMVFSLFKMASITEEGQALAQDSQAIQVS